MAQDKIINVTSLVDDRKLSWFNIQVVLLSFIAAAVDGFDLQAAALAGPALVRSWHVAPAALGPMFSASMLGMLFGGPLVGYISDRFGRKPAILLSMLAFGGFTLLSVAATTLNELTALRFLTGFGLGGLTPTLIALNAEFAPRRGRPTLIVLMYLGVNLGSMVPGTVVAILGHDYRWQTLFLIGGIAPLVGAALLGAFLPESLKFLVVRKKSRAKITRLLARLKPDLDTATAEIVTDDIAAKGPRKLAVTRLFTDGMAGITTLIWSCYILILMANNFLHNWMPILFRADGLSVEQMGIITAMYNLGGATGALVISRAVSAKGIAVLVGLFALTCPLAAGLGIPGMPAIAVGSLVFLTGFCIFGIEVNFNATAGVIYPTHIRTTGVGWARSMSRLGAVAGTMAGAWLLSMHLSTQQLFLAPSVPLLFGLVGTAMLMRLCQIRFRGNELADRAASEPSMGERSAAQAHFVPPAEPQTRGES